MLGIISIVSSHLSRAIQYFNCNNVKNKYTISFVWSIAGCLLNVRKQESLRFVVLLVELLYFMIPTLTTPQCSSVLLRPVPHREAVKSILLQFFLISADACCMHLPSKI